MTYSYSFFDYVLESDIALPELVITALPSKGRRLKLELGDTHRDNFEEVHRWEEDNNLNMRCEQIGDEYRLVFGESLKALCIPGEGKVVCDCDVADFERSEFLRHLLLDQVLPRLACSLGELILHASCVTNWTRTIAFIGRSGAGKSTMAAGFLNDGWRLLSDDCVLIRQFPYESPADSAVHPGWQVLGAYPGLKLLPDSIKALLCVDGLQPNGRAVAYGDKVRVSEVACDVPPNLELAALVHLADDPTSTALAAISGARAAMVIMNETFSMNPRDLVAARHRLPLVTGVAERTRFFSMPRQRNFNDFAAVRQQIRATIGVI